MVTKVPHLAYVLTRDVRQLSTEQHPDADDCTVVITISVLLVRNEDHVLVKCTCDTEYVGDKRRHADITQTIPIEAGLLDARLRSDTYGVLKGVFAELGKAIDYQGVKVSQERIQCIRVRLHTFLDNIDAAFFREIDTMPVGHVANTHVTIRV